MSSGVRCECFVLVLHQREQPVAVPVFKDCLGLFLAVLPDCLDYDKYDPFLVLVRHHHYYRWVVLSRK